MSLIYELLKEIVLSNDPSNSLLETLASLLYFTTLVVSVSQEQSGIFSEMKRKLFPRKLREKGSVFLVTLDLMDQLKVLFSIEVFLFAEQNFKFAVLLVNTFSVGTSEHNIFGAFLVIIHVNCN